MARMIGQPAVGWTWAESLLGNGRALSENSKAVWARQDSEKAAKAVSEKKSSLLSTCEDISRFFIQAAYSGKLQLLVCRTRTHCSCRIRVCQSTYDSATRKSI